MTRITGDLMREVAGEDCKLLPDLKGDGFVVRNTAVKRMKSTDAPVYLFEVIDTGRNRIGVASLVCERALDAVREFGHVCVTLAEQASNAILLANVASVVFGKAYEMGLDHLRVVIPHDHAPSIAACEALRPQGVIESLELRGQQFLAYSFQKDNRASNGVSSARVQPERAR
jgi:hypothetical protein